ncbi:MAG: transposase [Candidatus Moranbacteria bacterium]|nr:transposase [Candidatus Moranbacteria bacterium]
MNPFDPRYMLLQEEKLRDILEKRKTVTSVASELSVSRQTVHKWLSRYRRFGRDGLITKRKKHHATAHNRTPEAVERIVIETAKEYWFDGVETLHDRIEYEHGIALDPSTVYRILKRTGTRYADGYATTSYSWKKKLYAHQEPGKELQMDTKYPFGYKQGKVIYTIIDDATRWVFAWSYETANADNMLDFLKKVLRRSPFDIRKTRTDQGKEFIANWVKEFLKGHHIEYRNNTPYCPEENGKIERFHRTLNEKAIRYGFVPSESLEAMRYRLTLFLHYHNHRKRHRGLGMDGKTPMERLAELGSVNLTLQCYKTLRWAFSLALPLYLTSRFYVWELHPHGIDAVIDDSVSDYLRMRGMTPYMQDVFYVIEKVGTVSGIVAAVSCLGVIAKAKNSLLFISLPLVVVLIFDSMCWSNVFTVLIQVYLFIVGFLILLLSRSEEPK